MILTNLVLTLSRRTVSKLSNKCTMQLLKVSSRDLQCSNCKHGPNCPHKIAIKKQIQLQKQIESKLKHSLYTPYYVPNDFIHGNLYFNTD